MELSRKQDYKSTKRDTIPSKDTSEQDAVPSKDGLLKGIISDKWRQRINDLIDAIAGYKRHSTSPRL